MSDFAPPPPVPPTGFPPAPGGSTETTAAAPRYWTAPPQAWPSVRPLRRIASAVRWLLLASAVGSVVVIGIETLRILTIGMFLDRSVGIGALESYDAISAPITLLSVLPLLAAGICWLVWQHRAAASIPIDALDHSPGWHVGSWFIPIAAWWLPVRNVADLIRASRAGVGSGIIAAWWTLWIGVNLSYLVVNRLQFGGSSISELRTTSVVSIIGELLTIGAAVFAWIIVARIADAIDPVRR